MSILRRFCTFAALLLPAVTLADPAGLTVQLRIEFAAAAGSRPAHVPQSTGVVVWLMPADSAARASARPAPGHFRMEQHNKVFSPHLLVAPLGSTIEFPNLDPFFHNVFSQFNGKRFDLGLYEAGGSRSVRFDHEGVSFIFCNIHSQMAAVIVTLTTPYYASASHPGPIELRDVPAGDYQLHVWAEGVDAHQLESLAHAVHIAPSQSNLGAIRLDLPEAVPPHKNKFGDDYTPDRPSPY